MAALKTTTVSRLEEAGIALSAGTVTAIARLCKFVGLTARSPLKQLEHFVSTPPPPSLPASFPFPTRSIHLLGFTDRTHPTTKVSDIIQGWRLQISPLSPPEWTSLSNTFSHVLCGRSTFPSLERALQLQMTFLHAVRAGLGEFNMMFDPILIRRVSLCLSFAAGLLRTSWVVWLTFWGVGRCRRKPASWGWGTRGGS